MFGMSNVKQLELNPIPYPKILELNDLPQFKNQFVYIIKSYKQQGLAVVINREDDDVYVRISDWDGNILDTSKGECFKFVERHSRQFITLMNIAGIPKAIFYITKDNDDFVLVDVRLSINKFSSPGMIRDLFSNIIKTQEVIKVGNLDDDLLDAIKDGKGKFNQDIIIKTSVFKTVTINNCLFPMYAMVHHQT